VHLVDVPELPRGGLRVLGRQRGGDVELDLRYRADRFGTEWAEEFLGDVVGLLGMAAEIPDIPLERAFGVAGLTNGVRS
jgi:hypothetical protein